MDRVESDLASIPACTHSAESGGFVEVSQQQLSEATSQRGWWETATTAVAPADESTRYSKRFSVD